MAATSDGRPNPWKTLGKLVAALIAAGVLVAGLALPYVGGIGLVAGNEADKFDNTVCNLTESSPPQRTTLYANDGVTPIATLFSQNRVPVDLKQIPKILQQALVATEDRRFYSHHGVDIRGLLRSAVSTSGGDTQGGSTLTMQYVKQVRYYQAGNDVKKQQAAISQNLNRKMEDAKCALYIENTEKESKDTILKNYLNIAFFGENSYGIQTAAQTYFGKDVSKLTLGESATLVGLLRAPSSYDPFTDKAAATTRRNEVIQNLVTVHDISQATANAEKAKPIALSSETAPPVFEGCANSSSHIPNAGFFCDYVVNWLAKQKNGLSLSQLQTGGYKIVTTLDKNIQGSAQDKIAASVPAGSPYTAVLPVVNPKNGDILAMAASKKYGLGKNETEQPLFTARVASGASTYKLFPLLSALSVGMDPDWTLKTVAGHTAKYVPKNCATKGDGVSNGDENVDYNINESLSSASAKSSNTFFLGLADQFFSCQLDPIIQTAKALGLTGFDLPTGRAGQNVGQQILSLQQAQVLVLGSVGTSPLELAGAYAGVANLGNYNPPAPVLKISDSNGNDLSSYRVGGTQVVPAAAAQEATDILKGDTKSNGTSADVFKDYYKAGGSSISGKTGTAPGSPVTQNGAIWFAGMTPDLTAVSALIDYDNPNASSQGLPGEGTGKAYGDYAAKIWLNALAPTLATLKSSTGDTPGKWKWPSPDGLQDVPDLTGKSIDDATSALSDKGFKIAQLGGPNQYCPSSVSLGDVAFYGPHQAPPGATITVCQSSQEPQEIYTAPVVKPKKKPTTGTTGTSAPGSGTPSGGNSGGSGGSGTGSGSGGGTGGGTGGNSGGSGGSNGGGRGGGRGGGG